MPRLAFGRAKSRTPSPAWRGIPMKDATKGREMDERTTRLLEITQAVDRAMGPMKPVLERTPRLQEIIKQTARLRDAMGLDRLPKPPESVMETIKVLNNMPKLPDGVVESLRKAEELSKKIKPMEPLRAPWVQARARSDAAPALEHRTPQNNDTAPTKQAPRKAAPNHEDEKQRTTNLERAVRVAMESIHRSTGRCATLDELIHYLKESDETGYILGAIGDEIAWSNTKGEKSTTGRRGIQKHWKKYAMTR